MGNFILVQNLFDRYLIIIWIWFERCFGAFYIILLLFLWLLVRYLIIFVSSRLKPWSHSWHTSTCSSEIGGSSSRCKMATDGEANVNGLCEVVKACQEAINNAATMLARFASQVPQAQGESQTPQREPFTPARAVGSLLVLCRSPDKDM